jgi:hypothetical protein
MNIVFETEGTTVFAVSYNSIINGYCHTELLHAEIDPALGGVMVRFESAWQNPIFCETLEQAKELVLKEYYKFKPSSVGRNYFLG